MVTPVIINFVLSQCAGGDPAIEARQCAAKSDLRLPIEFITGRQRHRQEAGHSEESAVMIALPTYCSVVCDILPSSGLLEWGRCRQVCVKSRVGLSPVRQHALSRVLTTLDGRVWVPSQDLQFLSVFGCFAEYEYLQGMSPSTCLCCDINFVEPIDDNETSQQSGIQGMPKSSVKRVDIRLVIKPAA